MGFHRRRKVHLNCNELLDSPWFVTVVCLFVVRVLKRSAVCSQALCVVSGEALANFERLSRSHGIPTTVRKTEVRTTPVRSQKCECQQCERDSSANETKVRRSTVRRAGVRMRLQCDRTKLRNDSNCAKPQL